MIINSALPAQKLIGNFAQNEKMTTPVTDVSKDFTQFLQDALQTVHTQQQQVEHLNTAFMKGEMTDVHTLMIASEKAYLGLELTVQVRNKAIEAYHEIMRMQI